MRMPDVVCAWECWGPLHRDGQGGALPGCGEWLCRRRLAPTGIALVVLVLYGTRLWPGIAGGAFLVNWLAGAPVLVACGMALGNTLEALIATVLLTRVVGFHPSLDRLRDVLGVIVLAAGLSTLVSATPPGDQRVAGWRHSCRHV